MKLTLLGEFLVKNSLVTKEQLSEALTIQRTTNNGPKKLLGEILIELDYCTEEEIAQSLAKIFNVPYIKDVSISEEARDLLPPEIMERYQAVPLWIENNKLIVAMRNLKDIVTIENIYIMTGYKVKPVAIENHTFHTLLNKALHPDNYNIDALVNKLGPEDDDLSDEEMVDTSEEADKPVIELANYIFDSAAQARASDIHIDPHAKGVAVKFRIDGVLHDFIDCPRKMRSTLVSRIKVLADMDIAERRKPQDGRITINTKGTILDIRAASLPTQYGEKLTLRIVDRDSQTLSLTDLGLSTDTLERYKKMISQPYGFILVAGPTGSGKSTTLYATLIHISTPEKHTITIEDPIERRVEGLNQIQVNRQAGLLFSTGLRALMRNDPDIIMVGEIRDKETAQMAVEASLTGHLVLSTIHTNDAPGAVTRLVEMGVEPFLVASSLLGVIAQRLIRVLCPRCKAPVKFSREELLQIVPDFPLEPNETEITLYDAVGCDTCHNTGYKGRIGIYEALLVSPEIRKAILQGKSDVVVRDIAYQQEMKTMRQDGYRKVKNGTSSLKELMRVVRSW